MKNFLFVLLVFSSTIATAQSSVNWVSLEEAENEATKSSKPILMDVYAEWCRPCQMLSKSFKNEEVAEYVNANFHAVKFNAENSESVVFNGITYHNPDFDTEKGYNRRNAKNGLTKALEVKGYPTIFIFDNEEKDSPKELLGYKSPEDLLEALKETK